MIQPKWLAVRTIPAFFLAALLIAGSGCRQESQKSSSSKPADEQELQRLKEQAQKSIQPSGAGRVGRPEAGRLGQPKRIGQPKRPVRPRPKGRPKGMPKVAPRKVEVIELPTEPTPAELNKRKAAEHAEKRAKEMEAKQRAIDAAAKPAQPAAAPAPTPAPKPAPTTKPAAPKPAATKPAAQ